jgi:hypothetical protein
MDLKSNSFAVQVAQRQTGGERDFCMENLLVRIYFVIEMIRVDRPRAMGI